MILCPEGGSAHLISHCGLFVLYDFSAKIPDPAVALLSENEPFILR